MNGAPWFKFFAKDFLAGVAEMSIEERGQYITLLGLQWVNGSVPADQSAIRPILLGADISPRVQAKFDPMEGGRMANKRLEREREGVGRARELAANRKKRMKEKRVGNATGTQPERVPDATRTQIGCVQERSGSVSVSTLPLGNGILEPVRAKRNPIQVESMPNGFEHLKDDFNRWIKGRGTGAKKATPRAVELAIKKMQEWGPDKARFILESAIIGNWQGLEDYGKYERQQGTPRQQPGGMNSGRTFNQAEHDALMAIRAKEIGL